MLFSQVSTTPLAYPYPQGCLEGQSKTYPHSPQGPEGQTPSFQQSVTGDIFGTLVPRMSHHFQEPVCHDLPPQRADTNVHSVTSTPTAGVESGLKAHAGQVLIGKPTQHPPGEASGFVFLLSTAGLQPQTPNQLLLCWGPRFQPANYSGYRSASERFLQAH